MQAIATLSGSNDYLINEVHALRAQVNELTVQVRRLPVHASEAASHRYAPLTAQVQTMHPMALNEDEMLVSEKALGELVDSFFEPMFSLDELVASL